MLIPIMHPTLARLYTGFERQLRGLDERRMQLRPESSPARWSVQQVVEHLVLTYAATTENYRLRLEQGRATRTAATVGQRVGQLMVCRLGMFPAGRQSPALVMPSDGARATTGDEMLQRVRDALGHFDTIAAEAERVFGSARAITHPVLGPLSVANWRRFHAVHGTHHLRQIRTILAAGPNQSAAISSGSTESETGR